MKLTYRVSFDVKFSDSFGGYAVDIEAAAWTDALEEAVSRWKRMSDRKMYNLSVTLLENGHPSRYIYRSITRAYAPFWGIKEYGDIAVTVPEKKYMEGIQDHTVHEDKDTKDMESGIQTEELKEARQYRSDLISGILEYEPDGKYSEEQLLKYTNSKLEKIFDRVSRNAFRKDFRYA